MLTVIVNLIQTVMILYSYFMPRLQPPRDHQDGELGPGVDVGGRREHSVQRQHAGGREQAVRCGPVEAVQAGDGGAGPVHHRHPGLVRLP